MSNNIISGNTATDNDYGIRVSSSSNNTIYFNDFNNTNNAYSSSSSNSWNSTEPLSYTYNGSGYTNYTGNYWSDYAGSDPEGDGIGNEPYVIDGSEKDNFPMMTGANASMAAATLAPAILVDLSGDLAAGSPSDAVNLTLNATNPGPENLTSVRIVALIPTGMSYIPGFANVEPDSVAENPNGTWTAAWENLSDLGAGESVTIGFAAQIDGDLLADLTCIATATGSLEERTDGSGGDNATGTDSWTVYVQESVNASISVEKTADPMVAEPGDIVTFSINVTNTGDVKLTNLTVANLLPKGSRRQVAHRSPRARRLHQHHSDRQGPKAGVRVRYGIKGRRRGVRQRRRRLLDDPRPLCHQKHRPCDI